MNPLVLGNILEVGNLNRFDSILSSCLKKSHITLLSMSVFEPTLPLDGQIPTAPGPQQYSSAAVAMFYLVSERYFDGVPTNRTSTWSLFRSGSAKVQPVDPHVKCICSVCKPVDRFRRCKLAADTSAMPVLAMFSNKMQALCFSGWRLDLLEGTRVPRSKMNKLKQSTKYRLYEL